METKDKEFRKLKFGLALKIVMSKTVIRSTEFDKAADQIKLKSESLSYRNLETDSGIPHPSIVNIVNGKKNPSWSTIDALLEGLELSLSDFAAVYDSLTTEQVEKHKKEIQKKQQDREKKKKKTK